MDLLDHFYSLVRQIPSGRVTTYGKVAEALGYKRAARAVGRMLHHNIYAPEVPCHRVVMSDGGIGGFGQGVEKKISMLMKEGVLVEEGFVVDFASVLFDDFVSVFPLLEMRRKQVELSKHVILEDDFGFPGILAAFDVAYLEDDDRDYSIAFGAMVSWDMKKGKVIDVRIATMDVRFPYIPTYLSFRELPVIEKLVSMNPEFDLMLLDANGILHPFGLGLASHAGVIMDRPSIGVAKGHLIGESRATARPGIDEVIVNGTVAGYSFISSDRAKRPIFISPGHRISPQSALSLVEDLCRFKIPEPLRMAHIEATRARKEYIECNSTTVSHEPPSMWLFDAAAKIHPSSKHFDRKTTQSVAKSN